LGPRATGWWALGAGLPVPGEEGANGGRVQRSGVQARRTGARSTELIRFPNTGSVLQSTTPQLRDEKGCL